MRVGCQGPLQPGGPGPAEDLSWRESEAERPISKASGIVRGGNAWLSRGEKDRSTLRSHVRGGTGFCRWKGRKAQLPDTEGFVIHGLGCRGSLGQRELPQGTAVSPRLLTEPGGRPDGATCCSRLALRLLLRTLGKISLLVQVPRGDGHSRIPGTPPSTFLPLCVNSESCPLFSKTSPAAGTVEPTLVVNLGHGCLECRMLCYRMVFHARTALTLDARGRSRLCPKSGRRVASALTVDK